MNLKTILLFVLSISMYTALMGQNVDKSEKQLKVIEEQEEDWRNVPSIRWNAAALINIWAPAASLVFEYPFSRRLGLELEGGPLLPNSDQLFFGERYRGFRARVSPKLYLRQGKSDLQYLRFTFRYERANSAQFRTVLDPSGSFQQDALVNGNLEMWGMILYTGYMISFWNDRIVLDLSGGLGFIRWDEQINVPDDRVFVNTDPFIIGQRNRLNGRAPTLSVNVQIGYKFGQKSK